MKQMFIWSSEREFDEQAKTEMQQWKRDLLGDDSYVLTDEDIADELQRELEDDAVISTSLSKVLLLYLATSDFGMDGDKVIRF